MFQDSDTFDDTVVFQTTKTQKSEFFSDLLIDDTSDSDKQIKCSQSLFEEHISSYESTKNTQEKNLNLLNQTIFQTMTETPTRPTQKVNYKRNGLADKLNEIIHKSKSSASIWRNEKLNLVNSNKIITVKQTARLYSKLLIQFEFEDVNDISPLKQNFMFLNESTAKFMKQGQKLEVSFQNQDQQVIRRGDWKIYVNISKIKAVYNK